MAVQGSRWIRHYHPAPDAGIRLVCLPHAGGSAGFFFPLSAGLSPAVDVLAIQYPGRQERLREPCIENLQELARQVFDALPLTGGAPVALFGHSMGGTVAFELARLMEAAGVPPVRLFASGRQAPSRNRREPVDSLSDKELIGQILSLGGTDQNLFLDEDLMSLTLPAVRSDYRAVDQYQYRPGPPLRCPVSVLVGDDDPKVTPAEADVWREHTLGEFDITVFTGGHFYLAEHEKAVLGLITGRLGAAR